MEHVNFNKVVNDIINGQWGNGEDRFNRLSLAFGHHTAELIQEMVNIKLKENSENNNPPKKLLLINALETLSVVNKVKENSSTLYHRNSSMYGSELETIKKCNSIIYKLLVRIDKSI